MRLTLPIAIICIFLLTSCNQSAKVNGLPVGDKEIALIEKTKVPESFLPQDISVVAVGDSLTEGVGDSTNSGGYVPYLEKLLEENKGINDATFTNFGVKGNRSDQLLKKLQSKEVKDTIKNADYVIVTIGGNDIMKVVREHFTNLNLDAFKNQKGLYEKNLKKVLSIIQNENPNSQIVLVGLYNPFYKWFADIKEINEIIDNWNQASINIIMEHQNAYFTEIADIFFQNEENLLHTDYFHPNDKGYDLMARQIFETISKEVLEKHEENQY
ncbi:lysophospholipase L1-like esterase [Cytobacillus eiseniae]|uniref:Lysophospholipase L1-like esterase n=1 Tax=Cytobacillus eiseniae TaxID=762947 RepID=A0ABS4REB5_9BACI|nr:SGNH/GDSL hydrolase family protein [Cytobacillus eiseniae]MBP2241242.1 lysophospholipase L1-like esterase [Cytobacillus eiseniae]